MLLPDKGSGEERSLENAVGDPSIAVRFSSKLDAEVIFVPDYNVSVPEMLIPATELSQHIRVLLVLQKADWEFTVKLVSLLPEEMHKDSDGRMKNKAELIKSSFVGVKDLQEQFGPDGVAQQGMELFQMRSEMIFDPLQGPCRTFFNS